MDICFLKKLYRDGKVRWSQHCIERMGERDISIEDFNQCMDSGEIIAEYPNDYPHPSCLILGHLDNNRLMHAVIGCDGKWLYVITTYMPSPDKYESDGKTRKEKQ